MCLSLLKASGLLNETALLPRLYSLEYVGFDFSSTAVTQVKLFAAARTTAIISFTTDRNVSIKITAIVLEVDGRIGFHLFINRDVYLNYKAHSKWLLPVGKDVFFSLVLKGNSVL